MDKNAAKRWRPVIDALFDNLNRQEAIDATVLLLDAAKRWRPVIENLFDNLNRQEAMDATFLLLEAPGQKIVTPPGVPEEKPRKPAPTDDAPKPAPSGPLDPNGEYTVLRAAEYIGIGAERMYQLLREVPEKFPHVKTPGQRGRYLLKGRGIIAFRAERARGRLQAVPAPPTPPTAPAAVDPDERLEKEKEHEDDEDEHEDEDEGRDEDGGRRRDAPY